MMKSCAAEIMGRYGLHVAANPMQATSSTCPTSLTQNIVSQHQKSQHDTFATQRMCTLIFNSLTHPGTIAKAYSTAVTVPATLDLEKMVLRK